MIARGNGPSAVGHHRLASCWPLLGLGSLEDGLMAWTPQALNRLRLLRLSGASALRTLRTLRALQPLHILATLRIPAPFDAGLLHVKEDLFPMRAIASDPWSANNRRHVHALSE